MNFDFSPEQEELRRQAQRVLGMGVGAARAMLDSDASYDAVLWKQIVELGWTAAAIPEALGGLGLGALEQCVLAEELGRTLAPVPFSSSAILATEALKVAESSGSEAAKSWLSKLATGDVIATVGFSEAGATPGWLALPRTRVVDGRISGVKTLVADAGAAQLMIVSARANEDGEGYGLWLVELDGVGVVRMPVETIDRVRRHAAVHFEQAPAIRLGLPASGAVAVERLMQFAAVLDAFEQLGGAEAVLALTVDYVKTRKAFGREVGGYQAVKHRLADMYVKIQLARSHAWFGAWALTENAPQLPRAAAGARLAAIEAFTFAAEEAVELHGGIGFTWESDCQLYYRRARLLAMAQGGRPLWAKTLAYALQGEAILGRPGATSTAAA
ncbi:acyl-CoA/acyl-ACP dehydrogenase [Burkholderia sp. R-69980]|nr:acyl-CoA/acyl-ACP dehydrogenase [Burkholderia sp. R-69980]